MNKAAVFHQMSVLDAFMHSDTEGLIKLRTAKNDVDKVSVHYTDKYLYLYGVGDIESCPMKKVAHDNVFDYYEGLIPAESLVVKYFFELKDMDGEVCFFGAREFFSDRIDSTKKMYDYPRRSRQEDAFITPVWTDDAIVYQIFPERFHRGPGEKHDQKWYGKVKWDSHLGGTLAGITHKLDYLEELGINVVYMTPVFQSPSNHKYNTDDYYSIDSNFGSKEDFNKLIEEAHRRDMKVIIDGVFNHSGDCFEPFKDLEKHGEASKYKDWFLYKELPVNRGKRGKTVPNYDAFAYFDKMPKLNTMNKELTDYLLEVVAYWTSNFAIDGWRLDVADEVSHEFWRAFRKTVKAINPEALLIGEIWYDSSEWLRGDEFDTVMNYKFQMPAIDWIAKGTIDAETFADQVNQVRGIYPYQAYRCLWNLLDSHDTARFLNQSGEDKSRLKLAAVLQMTFTGTPFIYYGTEVGMTGGHDPDCRRGMLWDEKKQDMELFAFYQKLIRIRKDHLVLRTGELEEVIVDNKRNIYGYKKYSATSSLTVILNNSEAIHTLDAYSGMTDLMTDQPFDGKIPPMTGIILQY